MEVQPPRRCLILNDEPNKKPRDKTTKSINITPMTSLFYYQAISSYNSSVFRSSRSTRRRYTSYRGSIGSLDIFCLLHTFLTHLQLGQVIVTRQTRYTTTAGRDPVRVAKLNGTGHKRRGVKNANLPRLQISTFTSSPSNQCSTAPNLQSTSCHSILTKFTSIKNLDFTLNKIFLTAIPPLLNHGPVQPSDPLLRRHWYRSTRPQALGDPRLGQRPTRKLS